MELLEVNPRTLEITIPAWVLLIKEFKFIVDRDKDKDKTKAKKELAVIGLMNNYDSSFKKYKTDSEIIKAIEKEIDIKVDSTILVASAKYKEISWNFYIEMFEDSRTAVQETQRYLKNVDYTKTDKVGKPIYDPKKILDTVKAVPGVLEELKKAEERFRENVSATGMKGKGNRSVSKYEIPKNHNKEPLGDE